MSGDNDFRPTAPAQRLLQPQQAWTDKESSPMTLPLNELYGRIDGMHLENPDIVITSEGDGFVITDSREASHVEDVGSSFEVPDTADEHGRRGFTAGPWTTYQYHASSATPNRDNYSREIENLAANHVRAVLSVPLHSTPPGCSASGRRCKPCVSGRTSNGRSWVRGWPRPQMD
jgi:hypothetical protein